MTTVQMLMIMMMMILAVFVCALLAGSKLRLCQSQSTIHFCEEGGFGGYSYYVIFPCGDGQSTESNSEPM